jgi:hypothetical protein
MQESEINSIVSVEGKENRKCYVLTEEKTFVSFDKSPNSKSHNDPKIYVIKLYPFNWSFFCSIVQEAVFANAFKYQ